MVSGFRSYVAAFHELEIFVLIFKSFSFVFLLFVLKDKQFLVRVSILSDIVLTKILLLPRNFVFGSCSKSCIVSSLLKYLQNCV